MITQVRLRVASDRRRVDVTVALALFAVLEVSSLLDGGATPEHKGVAAVGAVFLVGALVLRSTMPGSTLVAGTLAAMIQSALGGDLVSGPLNGNNAPILGGIASLIALLMLGYSAAAGLPLGRSVGALAVGAALMVWCGFLPGDGGAPSGASGVVQTIFYSSLTILPGWVVGRLARAVIQRSSSFRELADEVVLERDEQERAAVAAERIRIGSELQDIIAQSVSAMIVQAGGARLLLQSDPDHAREAILTVEHTGREALADLRRLLGVLRNDGERHALSPQPGLHELRALLDDIRPNGLDFELGTSGKAIELPPGVDLVGYRIVEAVLSSAASHRVEKGRIAIRYTAHAVELEINGDHSIPDLDQDLEAIIRRVELYDGSIRTRDAADGFELRARLPVREASLA